MDCLIKHSLSYVIENLVKKLIENINSYAHLTTTDDWRLLVSLDETVENERICESQCLGCLEFARMMSIFFNFTNGILKTSEKNKIIVNELRGVFDIPEECHPITLALDLVAAPEYVKSKIPEKSIPAYEKYVDAVKGEVSRLALDHFLHEQAKCMDTVLSYGNLEQKQIISYEPVERAEGKEVFYIDQNIISKYGNDKNLKQQIENFKSKVNCWFVYSPYVIEDGVKMSRVRLAEYFESVEALTDSTMLVRSEEDLTLAKEDIQITFDRVLLWRNATRAAEDLKIHKMHFNQWGYPHYARDSRLSKRANKNIGEFLESLRPHLEDRSFDIDFDDFESDRALCWRLHAATIEKSFSLQGLVDRSVKHESDAECMEHIGHLCDFLDLINYQTESLSDLNKIRSSLQDTEHLKHAWKADYFVTDDQRLRTRGEFIYSVLGLKTRFIKLNDLKGMIASAFKHS